MLGEFNRAEPAHSPVQIHCSQKTLQLEQSLLAVGAGQLFQRFLSVRQDIQPVVRGSQYTFSAQCGQAVSVVKSPLMSDMSQLSFWPLSSLHSQLGFNFDLVDP